MTDWTAPSFSWPVRVYWEDTDGGGVVYYANYLRFLERARTEHLRAMGVTQSVLAKETGTIFVVTGLTIDYRRPARLDDALVVTSDVTPDGLVCLQFRQRICREEAVLVEASVRAACIDAQSFRPKRIPAVVVNALRGMQSPEGVPAT